MQDRIPTSVLSIIKAEQIEGEKLTLLTCRMTGEFKPFTDAVIFPGEKKFQVKDIVQEDGDIYKVKVKGIPFKLCLPFSVITPTDLKIKYSKRGYFMPEDFHSKDYYNGEYYVKGGIFTGYRMFKKDTFSAKLRKTGNLYCVDFPFKSPMVPGALYSFENPRGFKGEMKLIYPGNLDKKNETLISSRVEKFRSRPGTKGIYSIMLRTDHYVDLPYFLQDEEFEGSIKLGNIRVMEKEFDSIKNKILKQSRRSGGEPIDSLRKSSNVSGFFFHTVLDYLIERDEVFIKDSHVVLKSDNLESFLSPLTKESYKLIVDSGQNGYSIRTLKNRGMESCFKELWRMNLASVLDDDLYYSTDAFKAILNQVFQDKKIDDLLSIQEIRDNTGLSRRYIISLLNQLEDLEVIEREDDDTRVIKKIP